MLFCRCSYTWIGPHEQWNERECSVDNPLNLYSLDISRLSIFATREGRLHVYSKWCRFEIPLMLSLSPGRVGARRRPRSYITHVPDARRDQVLRLWVCGGRKRFMAWNDNIGHPIVTKSTIIYVALVEGLRRRGGSIVNLTIYGNLGTLIRSKEICLYLYGGFRPLSQGEVGNQRFKKCDLTCVLSFLPDSSRVGSLEYTTNHYLQVRILRLHDRHCIQQLTPWKFYVIHCMRLFTSHTLTNKIYKLN